MRYPWIVILGFFLTSSAHAGETAWLCKSRIDGWVPILGRLFHSSVLICPEGECPAVIGPDGKLRSNPACASYGTQPKTCHFLYEDYERVGVRCTQATIPVEEVKFRIRAHRRRWRIWYNCQHSAAEVTGLPGR